MSDMQMVLGDPCDRVTQPSQRGQVEKQCSGVSVLWGALGHLTLSHQEAVVKGPHSHQGDRSLSPPPFPIIIKAGCSFHLAVPASCFPVYVTLRRLACAPFTPLSRSPLGYGYYTLSHTRVDLLLPP